MGKGMQRESEATSSLFLPLSFFLSLSLPSSSSCPASSLGLSFLLLFLKVAPNTYRDSAPLSCVSPALQHFQVTTSSGPSCSREGRGSWQG